MANSLVGYIALLRQLASFVRLGRPWLDPEGDLFFWHAYNQMVSHQIDYLLLTEISCPVSHKKRTKAHFPQTLGAPRVPPPPEEASPGLCLRLLGCQEL